jgi:putative sterol carrier protein
MVPKAPLNRHSLSEDAMAVDIQKLFNDELPANLTKNAEDVKTIGAKFQMNITGDGGGEWFIDASATGPVCKPGTGEAADCTLTIAAEDFQKLVENPQANGMALFFAGKLKVAGNQMLAMKLNKLFGYKS